MSNNEHAIVNTWNTPEFRADLAFPKLTDEMVERLRPYGREETFPANALLFTHGERQVDMFVVLDGEVEVALQAENGVSKVIARHSTYYFTGELNMLNSQGSLVEGRTVSPSRLLRIPRNELQRLMRAALWAKLPAASRCWDGATIRKPRSCSASWCATRIRTASSRRRSRKPHCTITICPIQNPHCPQSCSRTAAFCIGLRSRSWPTS
jgi:CRP-like cAMP-binding protein